MTVRVVPYNILVPKLAEEPGYHHRCDPRFLDKKYRWNLLEKMLQEEIVNNRNTIICLQELSPTMLLNLHVFFRQMHYVLHSKPYGDERNDNMGIGIAIPDSMQLTSASFIHIGDEIRSRLHDKGSNILNIVNWFLKDWANQNEENSSDPLEVAMNKRNILVCSQVVVDGIPLCIGTYHMPVMFRMPDVMMIHASIVKDTILNLAHRKNVILAGDFNTKPSDEYYRVITERGFIRHRLPKSENYNISYQPNVNQVLNSAYKVKNEVEPNFTNFAATSNHPTFCATLDYIVFDGRLTVENVLRLPRHPKGKSYPDAAHPSDHLMIAATFRLY